MRDLVRPARLGHARRRSCRAAISSAASRQREQRPRDPPREIHAEQPRDDHAAGERDREPLDQCDRAGCAAARSGFATTIAPSSCAFAELAEVQRQRDGQVLLAPYRGSSSVVALPPLSFDRSTVFAGRRGSGWKSCAPGNAGTQKIRSPPIARSRLGSGTVARAALARVQLHDADRLRAELDDRPGVRVRLEEPDHDQRRDQPGKHDSEQEQRRQAEAQRAEHGASLLGSGGRCSRAGLTL